MPARARDGRTQPGARPPRPGEVQKRPLPRIRPRSTRQRERQALIPADTAARDPEEIDLRTRTYRCGLAALQQVDRTVGRLYKEFKRLDELGKTVFIFYSDNGLLFGEHRIRGGKLYPYEEADRTPLFIRLPARYRKGQRVAEVSAPVANIDFAPTILRLADQRPCRESGRCRVMDGRSLLPLLRGKRPKWAANRPLGVEVAFGTPTRARRVPVRGSAAARSDLRQARQGRGPEHRTASRTASGSATTSPTIPTSSRTSASAAGAVHRSPPEAPQAPPGQDPPLFGGSRARSASLERRLLRLSGRPPLLRIAPAGTRSQSTSLHLERRRRRAPPPHRRGPGCGRRRPGSRDRAGRSRSRNRRRAGVVGGERQRDGAPNCAQQVGHQVGLGVDRRRGSKGSSSP